MRTRILARKLNLAEATTEKGLAYDPVAVIVEGLLNATGKEIKNREMLEAFGVNIKETVDTPIDVVQTEFLAENLYNPLLTIHNLKKQGRIESINLIAEAYDNFIGLVNRLGAEVEKDNQAIIESAVNVFKKATKE